MVSGKTGDFRTGCVVSGKARSFQENLGFLFALRRGLIATPRGPTGGT